MAAGRTDVTSAAQAYQFRERTPHHGRMEDSSNHPLTPSRPLHGHPSGRRRGGCHKTTVVMQRALPSELMDAAMLHTA